MNNLKRKAAALFVVALVCAAAASCQKGNPKLKTKTLSIATASGATVRASCSAKTSPTEQECFLSLKRTGFCAFG